MENNKKDASFNTPLEIDIKKKNIKYPFSGIAPNLIDKFLVLGYEQKTIDTTYKNCIPEDKPELKTRFKFLEFEERPYIVNEICNDYSKDWLDNDLILELIFPNNPQMYFLDKQYINAKKEIDDELLIGNYSIIFSINPQDNSGSKRSYNGLGYIFYVVNEYRIEGELIGYLYVPMAYVILSEYPYFYHFNEICKNVYLQMKRENDEIPIDILLYNTVKYTPSPISKSINLSFGASIGFPQDKNNKIEEILSSLNSISSKDNKGIPTMFFNQLSGYPFMDINLSFIFNLIPPEIIVEVFIFSFLEHDIIFYSSRPEILNMVMYIFSCFNYPFNDSIYYWHILSVSQQSFMSGTSTFVGKTCSTLTGILNEYDPELLTTKKIREHFVLDIDNKNFFFLYQEETDDVKDTMNLYNYIKNCTADAEEISGDSKKMDKETKIKNYFNDGIQLYEVIRNLMEELQRRAKKVTSTNYNEKIVKPTFLTMYEDESEMECMKANMRLQKAFFSFITQIMQNFVRILSIEENDKRSSGSFSETGIPSIVINIKKEENINEEEEIKRKLAKKAAKIFKNKFLDCSKYSSFVINFSKFHETIDLYKIPYTFINEFVYYSHVAVRNNLSEVDVFKLIDQFYGKRKMVNFREIIEEKQKEENENKHKIEDNKKNEKNKKEKEKDKKKKNKKDKKEEIDHITESENEILEQNGNKSIETDLRNIYLFTFDKFIEFYKEKLRAYINREQEDDKNIFVKVKSTNKIFKKYKRNGFLLSNKILNIYATFSNNHVKELIQAFQLIKCEYESPKNSDEINKNSISGKSLQKIIKIENDYDSNQNKIDYYYLLQNKLTDKAERDLKLFGSYEFMEITDVIESHFILERCFTSLGLIKFSLLNVLAVTRALDGQKITNKRVISTMCDFCEKTKSLVRKYMNIYLNIFQTMKVRKILPDIAECDECLNIITLYFKKTNMIPTEETSKAFTEIKETESKNSSLRSSTSSSNSLKEEESNFKKLYEEKGKFFEIKEGFLQKINTRKKFEEILKTIETIFSGSYRGKGMTIVCEEFEGLCQKKDKEKYIPITPLSLYDTTNKILINYLKTFTLSSKEYEELHKDVLSLLYYFKIPIIGLKWIEQWNPPKERFGSLKLMNKDKKDKKPEKKEEEKNPLLDEINSILKRIIAILCDLLNVLDKKS